jgi:hypothetical protein
MANRSSPVETFPILPGADRRRVTLSDDLRRTPAELLHEYFHGDTGADLGASHQAGWTAWVLDLVPESR